MSRRRVALLSLAVIACTASSAWAAGETVTAADPEGLASAMRAAGYRAELSRDVTGEPEIETEFYGWSGAVRFYDCNAATHGDCRSLQLQVGFDRARPMPPELVNYLLANNRYITIFTDETGDPWLSWDVFTGQGIPTPVFIEALHIFSGQVELVANAVFEEERAAQ